MKRNLLVLAFILVSVVCYSQQVMRIWDETNENNKNVTLQPFIPDNGNCNKAVIVCPGGSYFWLDYKNEGVEVAKWLQQNGIAAFVLKYRTGGFGAFITHYRKVYGGNKYPDMIRDVQRSIQLIRENAVEFRVDTNAVGVMGFSAGGHLAMSSAVFANTSFLSPLGIKTDVSLKPNFVAPIYPVVTFNKPYTHKRSMRGILSEKKKLNNKTMRDSLSIENNINENCPPVFLVNCKDDPIVDFRNSILLDSALNINNVHHKYILYETGGHGFGASEVKGTKECRQWKDEFIKWINNVTRL